MNTFKTIIGLLFLFMFCGFSCNHKRNIPKLNCNFEKGIFVLDSSSYFITEVYVSDSSSRRIFQMTLLKDSLGEKYIDWNTIYHKYETNGEAPQLKLVNDYDIYFTAGTSIRNKINKADLELTYSFHRNRKIEKNQIVILNPEAIY